MADHNHITRDIKEPGKCPGCDEYHTHEQERQKADWAAFVAASHAKGECEFSGLKARQCQRTICDCFETPEGAAEIERKAAAGG